MASPVDICNLALSHLGNKAQVSSIAPSDKSTEANLCVIFYPQARDLILEEYDWNFAIRTVALADLGSPPSGWAYRYDYPNLCLRPISIKTTNDDIAQDYMVQGDDTQGRVVLTNTPDAEMVFVQKITDTGLFTPTLVEAISWLLASYLAGPLTKSSELSQNALAVYALKVKQAQAMDAMAEKLGGPRVKNDKYIPSGIAARNV